MRFGPDRSADGSKDIRKDVPYRKDALRSRTVQDLRKTERKVLSGEKSQTIIIAVAALEKIGRGFYLERRCARKEKSVSEVDRARAVKYN